MYSFLRRIILFALIAIGSLSEAREIVLFDLNWQFVPAYDDIIYDLLHQRGVVPGADTLRLGDRVFKYEGALGEGNTTAIIAISGNKALRLPIGAGDFRSVPYSRYIDYYMNAWPLINSKGLPTVKAYLNESVASRFIVVERLEVLFTLADLFQKNHKVANISESFQERALDNFVDEFAPKTAAYSKISDLRADQIAFTNHGWLLLDFTSEVLYAHYVNDDDLLTDILSNGYGGLSRVNLVELERRAKQKIFDQRSKVLKLSPAEVPQACRKVMQHLIQFESFPEGL